MVEINEPNKQEKRKSNSNSNTSKKTTLSEYLCYLQISLSVLDICETHDAVMLKFCICKHQYVVECVKICPMEFVFGLVVIVVVVVVVAVVNLNSSTTVTHAPKF